MDHPKKLGRSLHKVEDVDLRKVAIANVDKKGKLPRKVIIIFALNVLHLPSLPH